MKVSELIEKLQQMPQGMQVWISIDQYAVSAESVEIDKIRRVGEVVVIS